MSHANVSFIDHNNALGPIGNLITCSVVNELSLSLGPQSPDKHFYITQ